MAPLLLAVFLELLGAERAEPPPPPPPFPVPLLLNELLSVEEVMFEPLSPARCFCEDDESSSSVSMGDEEATFDVEDEDDVDDDDESNDDVVKFGDTPFPFLAVTDEEGITGAEEDALTADEIVALATAAPDSASSFTPESTLFCTVGRAIESSIPFSFDRAPSLSSADDADWSDPQRVAVDRIASLVDEIFVEIAF